MNKVFKYRIYANQSTLAIAGSWLDACRNLYNLCLEQRIFSWKNHRKYTSLYQQSKELTELRKEFPALNEVNRDVLDKV